MEKKYSVSTEDGEIVSIEVDGVQYSNPGEISDPEDRAEIEKLLAGSMDSGFGDDFDRQFEADFRQLESQSVKFPSLILGIFLTVAVIMLVIAAISGVSAARKQAREESTSGQVVDMVLRSYRDAETQAINEYYYPVVEFSLPDASRRTVQLSEGSWPAAYAKGDAVTVLYDPQRPNDARIQSTSSTLLAWILPGITGLLAIAFLGATFLVHWITKPEPT